MIAYLTFLDAGNIEFEELEEICMKNNCKLFGAFQGKWQVEYEKETQLYSLYVELKLRNQKQ